MPSRYLELSRNTLQQVNIAELTSLEVSQAKGFGSVFTFKSLGKIPGTEVYGGLKIPRTSKLRDAELRLAGEMAQIALHVEATPEIAPHVPAFMGLVAVENTDLGAILTEDASQNGNTYVASVPVSEELREKLYVPYRDAGDYEDVISELECDDSVGFDVGDKEMLLDFTPPPVRINLYGINGFAPIQEYMDEIWDAVPDLTVTVPHSSTIGQSIRRI